VDGPLGVFGDLGVERRLTRGRGDGGLLGSKSSIPCPERRSTRLLSVSIVVSSPLFVVTGVHICSGVLSFSPRSAGVIVGFGALTNCPAGVTLVETCIGVGFDGVVIAVGAEGNLGPDGEGIGAGVGGGVGGAGGVGGSLAGLVRFEGRLLVSVLAGSTRCRSGTRANPVLFPYGVLSGSAKRAWRTLRPIPFAK
jgi:hypothetical protein